MVTRGAERTSVADPSDSRHYVLAVDPDPVMPDAAGGVFADAVTVMAAVATVLPR